MTEHVSEPEEGLFGAERAKAFIDAVVAIAMTLLILPLMESVSESASRGDGAAGWVGEHSGQLVAFVLSFVIIAMFWMGHHRLFTGVEKLTPAFLWITMAWVLSIVWLPVATAMSGAMSSDDLLVRTVYIGSMLLTSVLSLCSRVYLRSHPGIHRIGQDGLRRGLAMDISMITLFALSLVLSVAVPALSYYPLFLMLLTGPAERLFGRMLGVGRPRG